MHLFLAIVAATWRNCEEWRVRGHAKSATFDVDPKNDGNVFSVYCDMTSIPAQMVFKHDVTARLHVGYAINSWYADVQPQYSVTMDNIEDALTMTSSCLQYIKYECNQSKLILQRAFSKWESRDSVMQYYWGDADMQRKHCACGLTGTCADPSMKCNCEIEDTELREDSGYLTDSSVLPVTRVVIRMSQTASDGYLTIGPLTCVDVDPRSFIDKPEGIATTIICSTLFLLFVFMISYACYKRRPWRKCQARRLESTSIEKLPSADKSEVSSETPEVEKPRDIIESEEISSSMAQLPRGPLHAIMPPSWNVHNFPIQSYKPGELANLLGAQSEADLIRLRMELNAWHLHPSPKQDNLQRTEEPEVQDASKHKKFEYNWNVDGVLLVNSLIKREQAERLKRGHILQPYPHPNATKVHEDIAISNIDGGRIKRKIEEPNTDNNTIETGDLVDLDSSDQDVDVFDTVQPSPQVNYANIQMVKDVVEQEKAEKATLSNSDQAA
ncbi:uncharacterized protein LOC134272552 [Saccostrea cucullata]|uniref:uncharacterized protein LOC134272552 n=1 Tax=Saccostrea cuccullata TaxID=36930 RepID=UPI002ED1D63E